MKQIVTLGYGHLQLILGERPLKDSIYSGKGSGSEISSIWFSKLAVSTDWLGS